jgi:hypothetical protein
MYANIPDMIKERAIGKYRAFVGEIDAVTAAEAMRQSRPDWPDQRWGIGQNGSIAGIVYHVAAWKQLTLPAIRGGEPLSRGAFDSAAYPAPDDWPGIVAWYKRIGDEWITQIEALPSTAYAETILWEGNSISIAKLILEIIDHDIQHASQIEYLRQLALIEA